MANHTDQPGDEPQADQSGRTTALLAITCTIIAMMQSIIAPLLTILPGELGTTPGAFTWAVTATLLAGAVFTPVAGRLGDMLGKKPMLVALIAPMILGSGICAVSTALVPMVIGRSLQGIALGAIPVSVALIGDVVPARRRATSIALVSASLGIGGGLALPISAAFAQFIDWRILFWLFAVLGAVMLLLVATLLPKSTGHQTGQRFDFLGAVLLAAGLVSLLVCISQGSSWGWLSVPTLGTAAAAVVLLFLWGVWELRASQPMIDLRTAARPVVLLTNAASVFAGMAMYITIVTTPQIMQLPTASGPGLGLSLLTAGLLMLPGGVIQMLLAPVGGRLINSRGPKVALIAGLAIITIGYASMQPALTSAVGLMVAHMIIKAGVGIAYGAMPALIMTSVSPKESGAANSFNTLMRSVGSSSGSAVVGAVLAALTVSVGGAEFISEAGFRVTYLIGCLVGVAGLVLAALIPLRNKEQRLA